MTVINQDARLYVTELGATDGVKHSLAPGRHAWVQVARGSMSLNDQELSEGDGAAISSEPELLLRGSERDSEILLFDLP